jgi:hypothetical protein
MMKSILKVAACSILVSGCSSPDSGNSPTTVFTGHIPQFAGSFIYCSNFTPAGLVVRDSCVIASDGRFRIDIHADYPDVYRLSLASNNFTDLVAMPGQEISLTAAGISLRAPLIVYGNPENDTLLAFDRLILDREKIVDSIHDKAVKDSDPESSNMWLAMSIDAEARCSRECADTIRRYAASRPASLVSLELLTGTFYGKPLFFMDRDLELIEQVIRGTERKYPFSSFVYHAGAELRRFAVPYALESMLQGSP